MKWVLMTPPEYRACAQDMSDMTYSFHIYECWPRVQMLSSTVPAHRMCQMLPIGFTFWDAGLHPDERSSALKYRACAQRVSDVTHSFYTLGCWPTPDEGSSALKYAACAQNVSDVTYSFLPNFVCK